VLHGQLGQYPVIVGDWVTIGHNVTVHGCVVEDGALIGIGAAVLNGARIGEGAIIAAGALVPERTIVPPRTMWAGVPAKQRRELTDADSAKIRLNAEHYLEYSKNFLNEEQLAKGLL
jgi:carbonic anhydrase/acetyltransferase-like protein (isoleucine patch superfamily)